MSTQCAEWNLNKIEKTFNGTFAGWKNMFQGFRTYFVWNPMAFWENWDFVNGHWAVQSTMRMLKFCYFSVETRGTRQNKLISKKNIQIRVRSFMHNQKEISEHFTSMKLPFCSNLYQKWWEVRNSFSNLSKNWMNNMPKLQH